MTYLVLALVVLLIGFVIDSAVRGPVGAARTGNQAGHGGHGSDGGGGGS